MRPYPWKRLPSLLNLRDCKLINVLYIFGVSFALNRQTRDARTRAKTIELNKSEIIIRVVWFLKAIQAKISLLLYILKYFTSRYQESNNLFSI